MNHKTQNNIDKQKLELDNKIKQLDNKIKKQIEYNKKKMKEKIDMQIQLLENSIKNKEIEHKSKINVDIPINNSYDDIKEEKMDSAKILINILKNAQKNKQDKELFLTETMKDPTIEISEIKEIPNITIINNNDILNNILIESNNYTEPEGYNNYIVELDKEINIKDIDLNANIPLNEENNINANNNRIHIKCNNIDVIFELEENKYNRYEICEYLNEGFKANNINIECKFDENYYEIKHNDNIKFIMINDENSILSILGFTKNLYIYDNCYSAENSPNIGDNIFYIEIDDLFRFKLNQNNEIIKLHDPLNENYIAKYFIIKIKKTPNSLIDNNDQYAFFFMNPHKLFLKVY